MKNLIVFLTLTFFSGSLLSHNNPVPEKSNRVYAHSGLKLRIEPSTHSEVIKVIPYGDRVTVLETHDEQQRIEWMNGNWVKVAYDNTEGYIFGGFISDLPMPKMDFELTSDDLDVTYPLISWAEHNFDEIRQSDTLMVDGLHRLTQHMENGITLVRRDTKYDFTVILTLPETEIEEAYNLVKSILLTKPERVTFNNKSIFVANNVGDIHRIKVQVDDPIELRKMKDGSVKILVTSFHHGCDVF